MSEANAWQPWLTAPKDGQVIVVATTTQYATINAYVCYWCDVDDWGWAFIDGEAALGVDGDGPTDEIIIGWAPFPAGNTLLDIANQEYGERERVRHIITSSEAYIQRHGLPAQSYSTSSE